MAVELLERPADPASAPKPQTKRQQWEADRSTYLGASDAAAVLGLSPFQTPHDVWLVKRGLARTEETVPMRRGLAMEVFLANEYKLLAKAKGEKVTVRRSKLYRHATYPFIGCNPDREVVLNGVEGILELKDVGFWPGKQFGQGGADQIPEHYLVQIMVQLIVTGKAFVQLLACVDGRDLRLFTYTLNPELSPAAHVFDKDACRAMFAQLVRWWVRHVQGGEEPKLTGQSSDTEYVQTYRATYENGLLTNTDEATDALCIELESAMAATKAATLRETEIKNQIKIFMAERGASALESSVGTFTYKLNVRGVASLLTPFKSGVA